MSTPSDDAYSKQNGGVHYRRKENVLKPWNGFKIGDGVLEGENIDKNAALMSMPLTAARGVFSQAGSALRALLKRNSGTETPSEELLKSSSRMGELEMENAEVVVARPGPIQSNVKLKTAKIPQLLGGHPGRRSEPGKSSNESSPDQCDLAQVLSLSFGGCMESSNNTTAQFAFVKQRNNGRAGNGGAPRWIQRKKSSKLLVQQAEDCQREEQRKRQVGATQALDLRNAMSRTARQPQARINMSERLPSPPAPSDKLSAPDQPLSISPMAQAARSSPIFSVPSKALDSFFRDLQHKLVGKLEHLPKRVHDTLTKTPNAGNLNLQLPQPFGKSRNPLLNWPHKQTYHSQLEGQCTGKIVLYRESMDGQRMRGRDSKSFLVKETTNLSENLLIETRSGAHTTRVIMHVPTLQRMFAQFKAGSAGDIRKIDTSFMNHSPSFNGAARHALQPSLYHASRSLSLAAPPINLCPKGQDFRLQVTTSSVALALGVNCRSPFGVLATKTHMRTPRLLPPPTSLPKRAPMLSNRPNSLTLASYGPLSNVIPLNHCLPFTKPTTLRLEGPQVNKMTAVTQPTQSPSALARIQALKMASRERRAATVIQAHIRAHLARQTLRRRHVAASLIQHHTRGFLQELRFAKTCQANLVLQAFARQRIAHKDVFDLLRQMTQTDGVNLFLPPESWPRKWACSAGLLRQLHVSFHSASRAIAKVQATYRGVAERARFRRRVALTIEKRSADLAVLWESSGTSLATRHSQYGSITSKRVTLAALVQINQLHRAYNSLDHVEEKESFNIGPRGLQTPSIGSVSPEAEFVVVRPSHHSAEAKPRLLHRYQERGFSQNFSSLSGNAVPPLEKRFLPSEDIYAPAKTQKAAQARFPLKPSGTVSVAKERNEILHTLSKGLQPKEREHLYNQWGIPMQDKARLKTIVMNKLWRDSTRLHESSALMSTYFDLKEAKKQRRQRRRRGTDDHAAHNKPSPSESAKSAQRRSTGPTRPVVLDFENLETEMRKSAATVSSSIAETLRGEWGVTGGAFRRPNQDKQLQERSKKLLLCV